MPMSTLVPRYTAEEVRRFPDDHLRYEVIRGELVVTPAPGTVHQRAVLELARRLQEYLKTHVIGEALPAPFEVEFTEDSAVQPDILVILDPQRDRLTAARLYGPRRSSSRSCRTRVSAPTGCTNAGCTAKKGSRNTGSSTPKPATSSAGDPAPRTPRSLPKPWPGSPSRRSPH